jgi:hypothetical protein
MTGACSQASAIVEKVQQAVSSEIRYIRRCGSNILLHDGGMDQPTDAERVVATETIIATMQKTAKMRFVTPEVWI